MYYGVRAEVTGEKWSASSRVARARGVGRVARVRRRREQQRSERGCPVTPRYKNAEAFSGIFNNYLRRRSALLIAGRPGCSFAVDRPPPDVGWARDAEHGSLLVAEDPHQRRQQIVR